MVKSIAGHRVAASGVLIGKHLTALPHVTTIWPKKSAGRRDLDP
jgi:hypothetical protein